MLSMSTSVKNISRFEVVFSGKNRMLSVRQGTESCLPASAPKSRLQGIITKQLNDMRSVNHLLFLDIR